MSINVKKTKTLEFLIKTRNSDNEDCYDQLLDLFDPENYSEETMEDIYECTLGYNPLTYFDERDIKDAYKRITSLIEKDITIKDEDKNKIISSIYHDNFDDFIYDDISSARKNKKYILAAQIITDLKKNENINILSDETFNNIYNIVEDEFDLEHDKLMEMAEDMCIDH